MSSSSPLDHPRLQAVAEELDHGKLDAAQRLLAEIGDVEGLTHGIVFLATRLLFLRGRLDADAVVLRLRDLVRDAGSFPEAEALLSLAQAGKDQPSAPPIAVAVPSSPRASAGPEVHVSEGFELLDAGDVESVAPGTPPPRPRPASAPNRPTPVDRPARRPQETKPKPRDSKRDSEADSPPPEQKERTEPQEKAQHDTEPEGISRPSPLALSFHEFYDDDQVDSEREPPKPRRAAPTGANQVGKLDALIAIDELWSDPPARSAGSSDPGTAIRQRRLAPGGETTSAGPKQILLAIPPAPGVPRITPPPDLAPSYIPPQPEHEDERPRLSDRVRAEIVTDGRYSLRTTAEEVIWGGSTAKGAASSTPTEAAPNASSAPVQRRGKIRSGRPPPDLALGHAQPTLFELANLLDQGRFSDALQGLGDGGSAEPAERALLRARAMAGTQQRADALATVDRIVSDKELEPDLRAAAARLLIDLGELEQALEQARLASTKQADSPLIRLTRAWAAVRLGRRTGREELLLEAQRALGGLKPQDSPHSGLLYALRACIEAQVGDAERALGVAQRALAVDTEAPDALAAVALASARLGRVVDAQQASLHLVDVAHEEAAALTLLFERMGIALTETAEEDKPSSASGSAWDQRELAWLDARYEAVVHDFERRCRERLSELAEATDEPTFESMGAAAAQVLTSSPVWLNFAPYDFTLHSLERVRTALILLYAKLPRPRLESDDFPVQVLVGAYVGETLCQSYGAHWEGSVADPDRVRVVRDGSSWWPLAGLGAQLNGDAEFDFTLPHDWKLIHRRMEPLGIRKPSPPGPPCPWDPETWPNPADIPDLAAALTRSVIGSYCARHAGGGLDGSVESLKALDGYLSLLAPTRSRVDPPPRWAIRAAALCGAYLGEVLRKPLAGRWVVPNDGALDADSYCLRIGTTETLPVLTVLSRLTGRSMTPIHEHAGRLLGRKP